MEYYLAILRQGPGESIGVEFPDFPGCISAGDTIEEAHRMATEALQLHVSGMREDGDPLPMWSEFDEVLYNSEEPGSCPPIAVIQVGIN